MHTASGIEYPGSQTRPGKARQAGEIKLSVIYHHLGYSFMLLTVIKWRHRKGPYKSTKCPTL